MIFLSNVIKFCWQVALLKPEATVKSAFGEFFEEEAKRPSERKKYKDAATTAAINAYLTGEKTWLK